MFVWGHWRTPCSRADRLSKMVQFIFSEALNYRRWRDLWNGAITYEYVLESIRGCQTIMSLKKAADSAAFFNEEERRGV